MDKQERAQVMSIRNPDRLREVLSDPKRLARAFSRHTYGMLAWVDIFGAKLGAYSRNDKLNTDDFEMLVVAEK